MNVIQGTKPAGRYWDRIIDAVVPVFKYNKITIDNNIYIKVLSDVTVSYLTFSTNFVLNTTANETEST